MKIRKALAQRDILGVPAWQSSAFDLVLGALLLVGLHLLGAF